MLTRGEIGAATAALDELRASVEPLRAAYESTRNLLSYVGWSDEDTRYARDAYEARQAIYENARARLAELVEDPAERHEEALAFVESVRNIARDDTAALVVANARNSDLVAVTGDVVQGTLASITTPALWPPWLKAAVPWVVGGLILAAVVPVILAAAARSAFGGRK